jgi:glycosyltransferase involved in cell wall biosynthesis
MIAMASSHSTPNRRALFVAYTFPPVGGAGVQRTTKFVKYLPQFGWDSSVLTVSNPSVPLHDESLCHDVPLATRIVRARTLEPSYRTKAVITETDVKGRAGRRLSCLVRKAVVGALQPDPQVLWNVPAFAAGLRLLHQVPHDAIVATAPPFSSLLLGAALSAITRIPLVMDYRDEWSVSHKYWENRQIGRFSTAAQRAMERFGLRRAHAVVATSRRSAVALEELCRTARSRASVTHIFNGFDPEDFDSHQPFDPRPDKARWRLVYTGTLYNLMSPEPLVQAIETLAAHRPDLIEQIELVFAGRHAAEQSRRLARLTRLCRLRTLEYVSHAAAIALMRSADALCILLSDVPGADRIIPAKVFEYIASQRPILAIAPPGDLSDLLGAHSGAFACAPHDVTKIADWIVRAVENGSPPRQLAFVDTRPFNRQAQARQLASLLDQVSGHRQERPIAIREDACSA